MALPGALQTAGQVLTAPVTAASGLFNKLAKEITDLNAPMSAAITNLNSFSKAATGLGGAIGEFVRAANPAVFQRFTFAVRDLQASFGLALMPALDLATKVVRGLADVFYSVATPIAKLIDAVLRPMGDIVTTLVNTFGPLLNIFGQIVKVVAEFLAPIGQLVAAFVKIVALPVEIVFTAVAKVLEILLIPLRLIAAVFKFVVDAIGGFIDGIVQRIRKFLGLKDTSGSSVGAAATNASLGSVESFQSKALTAAFMSGKGADEEKSVWEKMLDAIKSLPKDIAAALSALLKEGAGTAALAGVGVDASRLAKEAEAAGMSRGRYVASKFADTSNTDFAFNLGAYFRAKASE